MSPEEARDKVGVLYGGEHGGARQCCAGCCVPTGMPSIFTVEPFPIRKEDVSKPAAASLAPDSVTAAKNPRSLMGVWRLSLI